MTSPEMGLRSVVGVLFDKAVAAMSGATSSNASNALSTWPDARQLTSSGERCTARAAHVMASTPHLSDPRIARQCATWAASMAGAKIARRRAELLEGLRRLAARLDAGVVVVQGQRPQCVEPAAPPPARRAFPRPLRIVEE